jgi:glutamate dehydrogenase/leucine dehydrogenase
MESPSITARHLAGVAIGTKSTNKKGVHMASTLITGLGLVGTSFAQHAIKRGESVVF